MEALGATCVAVTNGAEAVEATSGPPFDVIFMDLQMPVLDGYGAAKQIRATVGNRSRIVALTATDSADVRDGAPDFDEVLTKPITSKMIAAVLHQVAPSPEAPLLEEMPVEVATRAARVLLVEDNELIAKITARVLEQGGCAVRRASHGEEALALLTSQHAEYDVVLMDILMPVMDGITATRLLRRYEAEQHLPAKPVIALSTNADPAHRNSCLKVGITAFLPKPIDYPILLEFVRAHCAH